MNDCSIVSDSSSKIKTENQSLYSTTWKMTHLERVILLMVSTKKVNQVNLGEHERRNVDRV